jgi:hypothetical protein
MPGKTFHKKTSVGAKVFERLLGYQLMVVNRTIASRFLCQVTSMGPKYPRLRVFME